MSFYVPLCPISKLRFPLITLIISTNQTKTNTPTKSEIDQPINQPTPPLYLKKGGIGDAPFLLKKEEKTDLV